MGLGWVLFDAAALRSLFDAAALRSECLGMESALFDAAALRSLFDAATLRSECLGMGWVLFAPGIHRPRRPPDRQTWDKPRITCGTSLRE